ncbi:MAG: phage tail fiber protein, partial [Pseudomonadota bacterium]
MSSQSKVTYVGDGGTGPYTVPFAYLDQSHVFVSVDGVDVAFSWTGATAIQLNAAASGGAVIELRRDTPSAERLVDFTDGSVLTEADLDNALLQQLYIAQEVVDRVAGLMGKDALSRFDGQGARLTNLADPVAAQDAATKGYVDVNSDAAAASATAAAGSATAAAASAVGAAASAALAVTADRDVIGRALPAPKDYADASAWTLATAAGVSAAAGGATDQAEHAQVVFAGDASGGAQTASLQAAACPTVARGQTVRVLLWAAHSGAPTDTLQLSVSWRDAAFAEISANQIAVSTSEVTATGGWVSLTATAPAGVRKA